MNPKKDIVLRIFGFKRWCILALAWIAGLGTVAMAANSNLEFITTPIPNPHGYQGNMALADVNHDGKMDFIQSSAVDDAVSVQLGAGNGTFGTSTNFSAGDTPFIVLAQDVNHDTNTDLLVGNINSQTISVLLGNGAGGFQNQIVISNNITATSIAVTDFDKDGNPDLIVSGYYTSGAEGYVQTLKGNGDGTFANPVTYNTSPRTTLTASRAVTVADFNGDTWPDFIIADPYNGPAMVVFLNNQDGTFTRQPEILPGNPTLGNNFVGDIVARDFNNDGKMDIAFTCISDALFGTSTPYNNVGVALGNGNGTFGAGQFYSAGTNGEYYMRSGATLSVADMDGDGVPDLVSAAAPASGPLVDYFFILKGQTNGAFANALIRTSGYSSTQVRLADINGDGDNDIIIRSGLTDFTAYLSGVTGPQFTSQNFASFIVGASGSFQVTASGNPAPTFTLQGALPSGLNFNANGLLNGVPDAGTAGVYNYTIVASNGFSAYASQNFTLTLTAPNLVVTTPLDEDNGTPNSGVGAGTSLREAMNYAKTLAGMQIITFDPSLAGQIIQLTNSASSIYGPSAFYVNNSVTIQGLTGSNGVTIANTSGGMLRLFMVDGGNLTLNDLTLTNGLTSSWGGAIMTADYLRGSLKLNRCTLVGNQASNAGGAINSVCTNCTLVNCTLTKNYSGVNGGAIYTGSLGGRVLTLVNVTVANNNCGLYAGGVAGAAANMTNTILANNTHNGVEYDVDCSIVGANNLIPFFFDGYNYGNTGGLVDGVNGNQITFFPVMLGPLANNGGPTPTMALLSGSPAINQGLALNGLVADQRGYPKSGPADIGACEYQGPSIVSAGRTTFVSGLANSFSLVTTGYTGGVTFQTSSYLPPGVSLSPAGVLAGNPEISGSVFYLYLIASNSAAGAFSQPFRLQIIDGLALASRPSFNTNGLGWTLNGDSVNGGPNIANNVFTPTDGSAGETRSAWFRFPLYVGAFQASFTYQDIGGGGADGAAFVIQNSSAGVNAIGGGGGGLGYIGISPSVALMMNIFAGAPGGASGVLVATNGLGDGAGYWPSIYQSTAPVDLDAGNPVSVKLRYTDGVLRVSLTDTITSAVFTTNISVNIPGFVGTNAAWVGFTGSEGGAFSHQVISDFTYTPLPALTSARGPGSFNLSWPASAYGFRLQSTTNLTTTPWADDGTATTQSNGMSQVVSPLSNGARFFRLAL